MNASPPALRSLPWSATRAATFDAASGFRALAVIGLAGPVHEGRIDDEEAVLLVLAGTHDFEAGGKAWPQRGVRSAPTEGRPLALFLPAGTRYAIGNGKGEVLLLRAALQRGPAPQEGGKEEFTRKPLLVMAGSGKAFDPASGAWRPEEEFAESPEFLLPRHITSEEAAGTRIERILPPHYKSRRLGLSECVLREGSELATLGDRATEGVLYVRSEGELLARSGTSELVVRGEGALALADASALRLQAKRGRAYVALATSGPKSST